MGPCSLTKGDRVQESMRARKKAWPLLLSVSYLGQAPGRVSERQDRAPPCGSVCSIICPVPRLTQGGIPTEGSHAETGAPEGRGKRASPGDDVWSSSFPALLRACAWPCQLGEHLLHELPAAGFVCLPRVCQVAGGVYHPVLQGPAGAAHTPVPVLDTAEPPERYWGREGGHLQGLADRRKAEGGGTHPRA